MRITEESMNQRNPELYGPGQMTDIGAPAPRKPEVPLTEREKLKSMNTKDKLWYIWEYYKWLIIGSVFAIFVLFSLGRVAYMATFKTAMHVMNINCQYEENSEMTELTENFHSWFDLNRKDRIIVEPLFIKYGEDTTDYSLGNMAKISATASAKELDVIIGDTATIDHYATVGAFQDLETALPPELLVRVKDRLYYAKDDTGTPYAFAIDISGTEFVTRAKLSQEPPLLGLVSNSVRSEVTLGLIEYIFQ